MFLRPRFWLLLLPLLLAACASPAGTDSLPPPLPFADGFEQAAAFEALFPADASRWHNRNRVPQSNPMRLETALVHSGTQALFLSAPAYDGEDTPKASLMREFPPLGEGRQVWTEMYLYLPADSPAEDLFLWDMEDPATCLLGVVCHAPGRRLYLSAGALASDLGKWWRGRDFRQLDGAAIPFPRERWVRLRVYLSLSAGGGGRMMVWQDEALVLDARGRTLPASDSAYSRLEVGITANGSTQPARLYLDDVRLWDAPPDWFAPPEAP